MNTKTKSWQSPSLGKDMELKIYGSSGTPIIALPTRETECTQWSVYEMVDAISYQLENEYNQSSPKHKLMRHRQYESYITEEVVSWVKEKSKIAYIIIAGIYFGACHAVSTALKHLKLFGKAIGVSAIYSIRPYMDDIYNDDVYYNNPIDFIPNLNGQPLLQNVQEVDFRLVSNNKDDRKQQAIKLNEILRMKLIEHQLDIWGTENTNEWDLWPRMLKTHII